MCAWKGKSRVEIYTCESWLVGGWFCIFIKLLTVGTSDSLTLVPALGTLLLACRGQLQKKKKN